MSLAWAVDLVFLFVTAVFAVRGLLRGLVGEVVSLAATVGGVILAFRLATPGGLMIVNAFESLSLTVAKGIAMVVAFVVTILIGALLTKLCRAFLSLTSLTFLDRLLGIFAGIVKSTALLLVAFVLISMAGPLLPREILKDSRSMELARLVWPYVAPYAVRSGLLPSEVEENVQSRSDDAQRA